MRIFIKSTDNVISNITIEEAKKKAPVVALCVASSGVSAHYLLTINEKTLKLQCSPIENPSGECVALCVLLEYNAKLNNFSLKYSVLDEALPIPHGSKFFSKDEKNRFFLKARKSRHLETNQYFYSKCDAYESDTIPKGLNVHEIMEESSNEKIRADNNTQKFTFVSKQFNAVFSAFSEKSEIEFKLLIPPDLVDEIWGKILEAVKNDILHSARVEKEHEKNKPGYYYSIYVRAIECIPPIIPPNLKQFFLLFSLFV